MRNFFSFAVKCQWKMKITSTYLHKKPVSLMKKSWKASNCLVRDMKSENLICFLTKIFSIENVSFCSEISTENGKTSEKIIEEMTLDQLKRAYEVIAQKLEIVHQPSTSLPAPEPMTQVPTLLVSSPSTTSLITLPVPETPKRKGKRNSKKTSFCVTTSEHLGSLKGSLEKKEQKIISIQKRQDLRLKKREEKLRADNEKLQVAKVKANEKKLSQTFKFQNQESTATYRQLFSNHEDHQDHQEQPQHFIPCLPLQDLTNVNRGPLVIPFVSNEIDPVEEPTKRKRGRPSKTAPKVSPKEAKGSVDKKSVGRPRKQKIL